MNRVDRELGRVRRRLRARRWVLAAAWTAAATAGGWAGFGPIWAAVGTLAAIAVVLRWCRGSPTRADAGDWIDAASGLPQTIGTYARCGPGPGGVIRRAAAEALAGRDVPRPDLLDRRLIWPTAALAGMLAAGFVGRTFTTTDTRPAAGLTAFADAGTLLGRPTAGAAARPDARRPAGFSRAGHSQ